jgi:hypothetical protein
MSVNGCLRMLDGLVSTLPYFHPSLTFSTRLERAKEARPSGLLAFAENIGLGSWMAAADALSLQFCKLVTVVKVFKVQEVPRFSWTDRQDIYSN